MDIKNQLENIPTATLQKITTNQAWHYQTLPFEEKDGVLHCVISASQPNPLHIQEELEVLLGIGIELHELSDTLLQQLLGKYYRKNSTASTSSKLKTTKDPLMDLIYEAKQLGSSDIHLEPYEKRCRVRLRIDGVLVERYILERHEYPSLVNKIKIRANLDIAEKRLPQDGRIFFQQGQQKFDIRVSVLPTLHGEKIVMRLLSGDAAQIQLEELGFKEKDLEDYLEGVKRPNGMVLISGPTGSGKTTTLYATLHMLNKTSRNITTIEDPIEYTLEGINQVQLRDAIGLDFASAMRTFLRQDPDIIMVGEIRDKATAEMAIRASLTGHLVFSTIHTNSAWGIVARLADMGVPAYLLADTLNTAVAQRLVRLLCTQCKATTNFDVKLLPRRYKAPKELKKHCTAKGCSNCHYTGYKGRTAIYEVISINEHLAQKIKNEEFNVKTILQEMGVTALSDNAFALLEQGKTSIEEIYPILASS